MEGNNEIAYLILAHRDPVHLRELMDALDYKADFYIHIDKKADQKLFYDQIGARKNVTFISKRVNVCWGGLSQVQPLLYMLEAAIGSGRYKRFFFITGADHPIISAKEIYELCMNNPDKEFICGSRLSNNGNERYRERAAKRWFYDIPIRNLFLMRAVRKSINTVLHMLPDRSLNCDGTDIYYGFSYWGITGECAKYLYQKMMEENKMVKYFKGIFAPIESLPHTIIFHSEYGKRAFEFDAYTKGDCMAYAPIHYVHYSDGTRVLTEEDYQTLVNSGKVFFEKCDSEISKGLIHMLEARNSRKEETDG